MADFYCNIDTGSDSNAGTQLAPFKTFQKGIQSVAAGDTLYMAASLTPYAWFSTTIPTGVSIIGDVKPNPVSGMAVIIDGGGAARWFYYQGSITWQNVWIRNASSANCIIYTNRSTTGLIVQNYTDCIISDLSGTWGTAARGGILAGGQSVASYAATSITYNLTNCLIFNIEATSIDGYGALFVHGTGTQFYVNLTSCTWYKPVSSRKQLGAIVADYLFLVSTVTLKNCTLVNSSDYNLMIHGVFGGGLASPSNCTLDGCTYTYINTTNATITNSTNADAQFLDTGANDFRLKPTSPAIDRGVIV